MAARRDSRTEPREHNQPQEEKNTRILFGIMNKERRGFTRGRKRKEYPKTPQALSGTLQSRTAKRKGNGNTGCTRVTRRELAGIAASTKPLKGHNLKKSTFLSLGVLSVFLGSSLVLPWSLTRGDWEGAREGKS